MLLFLFTFPEQNPHAPLRNWQVSIMHITVGLYFVVLELELAPLNLLNSPFSCNVTPLRANPVEVSSFYLIYVNAVVFAAERVDVRLS